jgi:uncharacterized membrane protein YjgN (DUF898 family)
MQDTLNIQEKINWKTTISLLLVDCMWSSMFYLTYMHGVNILKYSFNYTAEQIIYNNFIISAVMVVNISLVVYLSNKIYPLMTLILSSITLLATPFLLNRATTGFDILIV